jgi:hypothetical protein
LSQARRIDWAVVQKLGRFAVVTGAAFLIASLALLVLIGPSSGAVAAAATSAASATATPAPASTCFPLSESSGKCYNAGEFCPDADLDQSGVALNGTPIACEPGGGTQPHWEDCTRASTTIGTLTCPAALASSGAPTGTATTSSTPAGAPTVTTTSASPGVTASTPAGAPATGGGTGPGDSGMLAAGGCAVMAAGAGLVFVARRRSRRMPV